MGNILILGKRPDILIVDDAPENLDVLSGILTKAGYNIRPVTNGQTALKTLRTSPPDLILMDICMRDMDGFELCGIIKRDEKLGDIPVMFISSLHDTQDKIRAFAAGAVDYITKPFQNEEVLARVGAHLRLRSLKIELKKHNENLENLVRLKIREISASQMATIFALAKLAESRDDATGHHLERVQRLCRLLCRRLARTRGFKKNITPHFVENLANACPLHDIGKVGIPDSILLKPGGLTADEFEIMKKHVTIGADTLRLVQKRYSRNIFVTMGIDIARHHHERWDGRGYPDGLAGARIPLSARIIAVIDTYDAIRSKRCYKDPRSHETALAEITRCGGTQFDPAITASFADMNALIAREWEKLKD